MVQGSDSSRDKMKARTVVVCACAIFMVFLVVETWCAPKNKAVVRNWGPQSMLYLKGRFLIAAAQNVSQVQDIMTWRNILHRQAETYGRRYASDNEEQYYKLNLEDFSSLSSTPIEFLNIKRRFTAPNMDIKYLE